MLPAGFEHTISAVERTQTHSLDRSATGIGEADDIPRINYVKRLLNLLFELFNVLIIRDNQLSRLQIDQ